MRRMAMLSFFIAGLFILASAAVVRADWYHQSGNPEGTKSEMSSPSSETRMEAPEAGTYEYQQALETGSLPPSEGSRVSGEPRSSGGEEIQIVDQGGLKFRSGVDDGP